MTFETTTNLTAQDVVNYALDGLVTMLRHESSCEVDAPGIAAIIDLIRGRMDDVGIAAEERTAHQSRFRTSFNELGNIGLFKDEFIRATTMDNEAVVEDVRAALATFCRLIGEHDERPITGREVHALANVINRRLDDFVIGADLSEALADTHRASAGAAA